MTENMGDAPPGSILPPATTQRVGDLPLAASDSRLAPPFVAPSDHARSEPAAAAEPMQGLPRDEESMPWETMSDEGVVEPVFEAETEAVMAELSLQAKQSEFPLDAFIIPEESQRVPSGLEGKPASQQSHTPLTALADRLEKLSHRLRVEETQVVVRRLAGGDKLDALLAGLLAGYLAGTSDQG